MRVSLLLIVLSAAILGQVKIAHSQENFPGEQAGSQAPVFSKQGIGGVGSVDWTGDLSNMSLLKRWPYGRCIVSYHSGSYLYMGNGSMLQVYNVSNPLTPELESEVMMSEPIVAITSSGTYLYVASEYYINIVNISDPGNPILANTISPVSGIYEMTVQLGYLYVAAGYYGLYIFSISDRANPVQVGTFDTPGYAYGVAVRGDVAYVSDSNYGVDIIDISDKAKPSELSQQTFSGYAHKAALYGDYLVVAASTGGIVIINVQNPDSPTLVASMDTPGAAYDVSVLGDFAYVADYGMGMRVINLTNITTPSEVGSYNTNSYAIAIETIPGIAFVSDGDGGLVILSISTPASPSLDYLIPVGGRSWELAVKDNFIYMVGINGFRIFEVGTPFILKERAFLNPGYVQGVAVKDNYVYLAAYDGLRVYDITNPSAPVYLAVATLASTANDVFIHDHFAYVTMGSGGLAIIEIANPSNPVIWGTYNTPGTALEVVVSGNYAYVADYSAGVQIIDVSMKTAPTYVTTLSIRDDASCLDVQGDFLYAGYYGQTSYGCTIFNISNPAAPTEIYDLKPYGWVYGIDVEGDYAYLACQYNGVKVFDIRDPGNPVLAGYYETADQAVSLIVDGGRIYSCDEGGGIYVLQEGIPPEAPRNLRANGSNPSPWQNSKSFTLSWLNPPDPSGIQSAKYTIGDPPTSNDDYIGIVSGTPPVAVDVIQEGVSTLHLWLMDGGAAESYQNTATVDLRYDKTILEPTHFSETHGAKDNEWQNMYDKATFSWRPPADVSGIMEYRIYFGTDPAGNTVHKASQTPSYADNAFEGKNYLRIEVEDSADNVLPWKTYFIFKYDSTAPQNASVAYEDHSLPNDQWQNSTADPGFSWDGQSDGHSGVKNFKAYFGPSPLGIPGIVFTENSFDPPPAPNSVRYLRIQTADSAGNISKPSTLFTFKHDGTPPENPAMVADISSAGSENDVWQNTNDDPNFSWAENPGSDSLSGIQGYYYYWGTDPAGTSTTNLTPTTSWDPPFVNAGSHYLRLKTIDKVGNSAPWSTAYVFNYDNIPPVVTVNSLPPQTASEHIEISWNAGSDEGGSNLSGRYNIQIKMDDGGWMPWRMNYEGTSLDTVGRHNHTYYFEVAGRDNAGNVESFSNTYEAYTQIDTTLKDEDAPGKPENLRANGYSPSPWYNQNSFELTWNNPSDVSGIMASFFKLNAPPSSNADYAGQLSGQSPAYVNATQEGGQFVYLWLKDGQGNVHYMNYDSVMLRMDLTKPSGTVAQSRALTDSLSFTVSWSGGNDQGGSGLSGKYYIEYNIDGAAWEEYFDEYVGMQFLFEDGIHDHIYHFRIAAYDAAGNREDFSTSNECSTRVDTTAIIDKTPPDRPQNLTAIPNRWSNSNDFFVQWGNPPGDESISGAYYKLSFPSGPQDGTFIPGDISSISAISVPTEGPHGIYVWLRDLSGNASHYSSSTTMLFFDQTPPDMQHEPAQNAQDINTNISINASAWDQLSTIKDMRLHYRKTGDGDNLYTLDFPAFSPGTVTIPSGDNTQRGVEYYITAEDSAGNIKRIPDAGFLSVRLRLAGNGSVLRDNAGTPLAYHNGNKASDYRIFSIPVDLEDKRPFAVIEPYLGTYDDKVWRLFDIADRTLIEYTSFSNQPVINPGKAFLMILNVPGKNIYSGPGAVPLYENYRHLPLNTGFNLIGNPFDFDIPVSNLEIANTTGTFWYFNSNGWISNPTVFRRWEGLAIQASGNGYLNINLDGAGTAAPSVFSDRFRADEWGIRIQAIGNDSKDLDNFIGVFSEKPKDEMLCWIEPPRFSGSVGLSIVQDPALRKPNVEMDNDQLAMLLKEKNDDGYTWNLNLVGEDSPNDIELVVEFLGALPEEFECYLIDSQYKMAYDLRETATFKCRGDNAGARSLKLVAGNPDYVDAHSDGVSLKPEAFELRQNFPNPFNPDTWIIFTLPEESEVTLDIYNILGQKIRTIYGNQVLKPGYQMVQWDGRNQAGKPIASGVYLIRLQSGKEVRLRKAVLAR